MLEQKIKDAYLAILAEEMVPAMGCTEPIALAYASAKGREVLGEDATNIVARCSGNMIKNVRCVTIPNSGGMNGIEVACILGALVGDASRRMEVLEAVTDAQRTLAKELLDGNMCKVEYLDSEIPLHFIIELHSKMHTASVEVKYAHTNIVSISKDGEIVFSEEEHGTFSCNE